MIDKAKKRVRDIKAGRTYRERNREKERRRALAYRRLHPKAYNPYKERARRIVRLAVMDGKLKKPTICEECGWNGLLHAHHEDYNKPFQIRWLCSVCHGKKHRLSLV